jgi:hypothetical protein
MQDLLLVEGEAEAMCVEVVIERVLLVLDEGCLLDQELNGI